MIIRSMMAALAEAVATWVLLRGVGQNRRVTFRAVLRQLPGDFAWYRERLKIARR